MKKFFYRIIRIIYARTGPFDEIIFSLPFFMIVVLIYWVKRRKIHKRLYGEEFNVIQRRALLNEIIRLLSFGWLVEVVFVALTPTEFWHSVWGNIISGEYLNFRIWRFSLNPPNLVPIVIDYIRSGRFDWFIHSANHFVPHFIVNVAFFVPLGLALPFLVKKVSFSKTIIIGLLCSFTIEILQCFIGRDSSVDDLICNTLGTIVGYVLYLLIRRLFPKLADKAKISTNDVFLGLAKSEDE